MVQLTTNLMDGTAGLSSLAESRKYKEKDWALVWTGTGPLKSREIANTKSTSEYEMNLGDFCLKGFEVGKGDLTEAPICGDDLLKNSNTPIDTYSQLSVKRSTEMFPFFNLPPELRDLIYAAILFPVRGLHWDGDKPALPLVLWRYHESKSPDLEKYYSRDYESALKVTAPSSYAESSETSTGSLTPRDPEEILAREKKAKETFERNKRRYFRRSIVYPHRTGSYDLMYAHISSWRDAQFVQDLSHVSRQFRQEIGLVLWSRVELIVFKCSGLPQLVPCLQDKPLLCKNLKVLDLALDGRDCDKDVNDSDHPTNQLRFIANTLELDCLKILLYIDERMLTRPRTHRDWAWLLPIRAITVREEFLFALDCVELHYEDSSEGSDMDLEPAPELERLRDKTEERMFEYFMPTSICQ